MREFIGYFFGPLTLPRVIIWVVAVVLLVVPCAGLQAAGTPWYYGLVMWAGAGAFFKVMFWALDQIHDEKERAKNRG